jgi:hypothetical protein
VLYLSGCFAPELINSGHPRVGLMHSPDIGNQLPGGITWAADNGCYSAGERFSLDRFLRWLDGLPREHCLFAVAPDVVADGAASLERSLPVLPVIRDMGFAAALVGQDGMESIEIPWEAFDAWFIGGSTEWKIGEASYELAQEAQRQGKWVHMGRVNSELRFRTALLFGCDSVDGTFLAFGPRVNWRRLQRWIGLEKLI